MIQRQDKEIRIPYDNFKAKKKAKKDSKEKYNYKNTTFKYTQPLYMNGMTAPFFISAVPAYVFSLFTEKLTIAMNIWLMGMSIASMTFLFTYAMVLRPSLLNGGLTLKYHSQKYRAVPFGTLCWILVWLTPTNFKFWTDILKNGYPSLLSRFLIAFGVTLVPMYVFFYWVLMVGDFDVIKRKALNSMPDRFVYHSIFERDSHPARPKYATSDYIPPNKRPPDLSMIGPTVNAEVYRKISKNLEEMRSSKDSSTEKAKQTEREKTSKIETTTTTPTSTKTPVSTSLKTDKKPEHKPAPKSAPKTTSSTSKNIHVPGVVNRKPR